MSQNNNPRCASVSNWRRPTPTDHPSAEAASPAPAPKIPQRNLSRTPQSRRRSDNSRRRSSAGGRNTQWNSNHAGSSGGHGHGNGHVHADASPAPPAPPGQSANKDSLEAACDMIKRATEELSQLTTTPADPSRSTSQLRGRRRPSAASSVASHSGWARRMSTASRPDGGFHPFAPGASLQPARKGSFSIPLAGMLPREPLPDHAPTTADQSEPKEKGAAAEGLRKSDSTEPSETGTLASSTTATSTPATSTAAPSSPPSQPNQPAVDSLLESLGSSTQGLSWADLDDEDDLLPALTSEHAANGVPQPSSSSSSSSSPTPAASSEPAPAAANAGSNSSANTTAAAIDDLAQSLSKNLKLNGPDSRPLARARARAPPSGVPFGQQQRPQPGQRGRSGGERDKARVRNRDRDSDSHRQREAGAEDGPRSGPKMRLNKSAAHRLIAMHIANNKPRNVTQLASSRGPGPDART